MDIFRPTIPLLTPFSNTYVTYGTYTFINIQHRQRISL